MRVRIPLARRISTKSILNKFLFFKKNSEISPKFKYNFIFVSLISPYLIGNFRIERGINLEKKKSILKNSYMLLTWFYYLSFLKQPNSSKCALKFIIFPIKKKIFTLTRAPMAHKNWSKEQYKFQIYKFNIFFELKLKKYRAIPSFNASVLFVLLSKNFFPQFETNLFFLKNVTIFFFFFDRDHFNYKKFLEIK